MNADYNFLSMVAVYRHELGYGFCAAIFAACLHIQKGDPRRIWVTEAILAGLVGSTADVLLSYVGITDTRAGVFLAFVIGFVGARTIIAYVMRRLGFNFEFKKADSDTTAG